MSNAERHARPEPGPEAGGEYLNGKLRMLGLTSNAEVQRITGVDASMVSKWRRGKATPTSRPLTQLVDGLRPLADAAGVVLDGLEIRIRYGMVDPADFDFEPLDPLYQELYEMDRRLAAVDDDEHQTYRRQLEFVLTGARAVVAGRPESSGKQPKQPDNVGRRGKRTS